MNPAPVLTVTAAAAGGGVWLLGRSRARAAASARAERNPGPEWGYELVGWSIRRLPPWVNQAARRLGSWVGVFTMPGQRAASREYLRLVLGREPARRDIYEHFLAFSGYLLLRLEICFGRVPRVCFAPGHGDDLRAHIASGRAALYGTFHLGHSDLVGFFLGQLGERIHMIRKRVANSADTDRLARRYAQHVSFIWINDWSRLILAMNDALRDGHSLAMQCDRPEYSSKRETFRFLGAARLFPFTIYHLGIMHGLPVSMSFAVPDAADPALTVVHAAPLFYPRPELDRPENFAAARAHFQRYLDAVEAQLRRTPLQWFNFAPLNPVAGPSAAAPARPPRETLAPSSRAA